MERPLIVISNDDGIEAPGLQALVTELDPLGEVWAVAPDGERSTSSHSLTLWSDVPVRKVGPRAYAVNGWPADCVYIAMFGLLDRRPSLVVSGINRGPNLGTDVIYSGTVGAAREAFTRGVPAMAVSLVTGSDYAEAACFARELAHEMIARPEPSVLLNVNVPGIAPRGVRVTPLGRRKYPEYAKATRTEGDVTYYRLGAGGGLRDALVPGSDGEAVEKGYVSVTPLALYCVAEEHQDHATKLSDKAWKLHNKTTKGVEGR
jgi:5'-nucleotidase